MTRREYIKGIAATSLSSFFVPDILANKKLPYRIGVCDWSLGYSSNLEAMSFAQDIGFKHIQLSMGSVDNNQHLRQKDVQKAYKALSKVFNIKVTSIGLTELNKIPYKSNDARTDEWVADSIDVAHAMGVKVVLLAFFDKGNLKNDPEGVKTVINKLKQVAPKAEKMGVTLGIESYLSAQEHVEIIEAVGSQAVKCYFDTANMAQMGYHIYDDIRWLGKQNLICEFHFKEWGKYLGKGDIDFLEVGKCIEEIGYKGNIQIEGSRPEGLSLFEIYKNNLAFLNQVMF